MNNIHEALFNVGLHRVSNYPYKVGDCIFYLVSYFKQLLISLIDLMKGVVQCLRHDVNINNPRVSHYYNDDFSQDTLMTLEQINSPYEYL
jgi:hypothetical protein